MSAASRPASTPGPGLRLLILNPHPPVFPGGGGVEWLMTRELARLCGRVGLVSTAPQAADREKVEALARHGVDVYLPPPPAPGAPVPHRRPPALARAAYRALVSASQAAKAQGRPRDTVNFDGAFRDMAEGIRDALASGSWHAVAVVQSSAAHFLDHIPRPPVAVLVLHDVRARLYARAAQVAGSVRERRRLEAEAARYERFERAACGRYDLVVTVTDDDAAWVREHYRPPQVATVPLPVDAGYFAPADAAFEQPGRIVFTGLMNHPPNADAAVFFAREVLPRVRATVPQATFDVVGRNPSAAVASLASLPGVRVTGEVDDVRPYLRAASVVVAPLRFGSGARQKILEAWALQKAVVSTALGAEGLGGRDGEDLVLADGAAAMAEAVAALLRDDAARDRLRAHGRRLVLERHDPARAAATYHQHLLERVTDKTSEPEPLRLALDLRWMVPGKAGGLESVGRALVDHLPASGDRYVALVPARCRFDFDLRARPNVTVRSTDSLRATLRWALRGGRRVGHRLLKLDSYDSPAVANLDFVRSLDAEIVYSLTAYVMPDVRPLRQVLLVADIQHEFHPEFFAPGELQERRALFGDGLRRADHVCAISEFTRATLIERLGVPPEKVSVAPLAAGPGFQPAAPPDDEARRAALGLEPGYLFLPAHTWPHKNHRAAVEALRILRDRHGRRMRLVCSGNPRQAQAALQTQIAAAGLAADVRFLGHVPAEDMPALYRGAAALVFPSLFEGFGMPVLEAMASGCPVVCADRTSLPEVAGDAALLVDPTDAEALATAVLSAVSDETLRADLRARGLRQAARFSWQRHVNAVTAAFARVRAQARRL